MTKQDVKLWVVKKASITKPNKNLWSASVTLGYDINEFGNTIEAAYQKLVTRIMNSVSLRTELEMIFTKRKY